VPSSSWATIHAMSGRQIGEAIRRRLLQAVAEPRAPAEASAAEPAPAADDARLDALRGELVRELDRLASSEHGCSADFRRI
jgi:ribosomal protein L12E/L44/L45/RPP1/RPP2